MSGVMSGVGASPAGEQNGNGGMQQHGGMHVEQHGGMPGGGAAAGGEEQRGCGDSAGGVEEEDDELMNVVNEEWEEDEYALGLAPSGGLSIPGGGRRRRQQDGWREAKQKRDSWLPPLLPLEPIVVPHK